MSPKKPAAITTNAIARNICVVRGYNVMLASALAELYQVETFNLNKAVRRNCERFPADFMFQLTKEEYDTLRFQFGMLERGRGVHAKYLPYAFTEQGVAMLSSVLRSRRAVLVNIEVMRTFARLRQILSANKDLARRLDALEGKYDKQFKVVFDAIRSLMTRPEPKRRPIGFTARLDD
jgi:ORF6N domain